MELPIKTVVVIAGPTAVGKTAISIAVARQLNTAIVSADSRQCYIEMNIGTATPTTEELKAVKHYFISEFSVTQQVSAAAYEKLALGYLDEIFREHDIAIVCGGTGLYIKALCEGLDAMPGVSEGIVSKLDREYRSHGLAWLQDIVKQEDPAFYSSGETQNPARLLRALSFIRATGESITQYRTNSAKKRPFRIIKTGLELPRNVLYQRINDRVDKMMADGLATEASALYSFRELKPLQTVGYAEMFDYIDGKCSLHEAVDKIKQHTRNYAKRQMTWFKRDKAISWFQADDKDVAEQILQSIR